jgi:hypothetical protein
LICTTIYRPLAVSPAFSAIRGGATASTEKGARDAFDTIVSGWCETLDESINDEAAN